MMLVVQEGKEKKKDASNENSDEEDKKRNYHSNDFQNSESEQRAVCLKENKEYSTGMKTLKITYHHQKVSIEGCRKCQNSTKDGDTQSGM